MTNPSLGNYGTYDESTVPRLWDGVVGAWCPSLGPTGSRLHDFSRYNNWGSLSNMDPPTDWVVSGGEYGLDFDGSNDGVSLGTNERLNPSQYCVSLWFTPNVVTAGQKSIYSQIDATGNIGKAIRRNANKLEFTVAGSGSAYRVWTSNTTYTATLTHGVVSWDSSGTPRMWINGVESGVTLAASAGALPAPAAQPLYIGCDGAFGQSDPNYNFAGVVFSATHWNRLLSPNEVRELYLLGRGGMFQRRRLRRAYVSEAAVKSYLFLNRGQVIGGGTL